MTGVRVNAVEALDESSVRRPGIWFWPTSSNPVPATSPFAVAHWNRGGQEYKSEGY